MFLVVGLGNPGSRYEQTRHNVGFLVVERLGARWGIDCSSKQFGALVGTGNIKDSRVALAMPQQFMNVSGQPVRSLMGFYKLGVDRLIVIHDDMDLAYGDVRLKVGGGHGGHNGLRDIHLHAGDPGYGRVRVGVGRPPTGWDPADYVLGKWTPEERDRLDSVLDQACVAVESAVSSGLALAMNTVNTRGGAPKSGPKGQLSRTLEVEPLFGLSPLLTTGPS